MASEIYTVRPGDTLSAIAARNGTTVADLARINGLGNPNKLSVGEKLHLKAETALAVEPLFLDAARNPIEGLKYRLQCGFDTVLGTSQPNGLGNAIVTQRPTDQVSIWAQIPWKNNVWEQLAQTSSGVGKKRVTLVSPAVRIRSPLQPHPRDQFGQPKQEETTVKPVASHPVGTPSVGKGKVQSEIAKGTGKGIHSRQEADKNGVQRVVLSQDLPDLRKYFSLYNGEKISDTDFSKAADILGCEVAVIKAFATVESGGGGFDHLNRPKILYERHIFSRHTKHVWDSKNAELSSPHPYTNKHIDKQGHRIPPADQYNGGQRGDDISWARFMKAWQLGEPQTEDAAIEACSWGMFQVLGENYAALGIPSAKRFMEHACTSERAQFEFLFIPFVQSKHDKHGSLKDAMVAKDWARMAMLYNGKNYKKYNYDTQLKNAYEKFATRA